MNAFLGVILIIAAFLLLYALAGRAWLKRQPWAQGFFAAIEPVEIALFKKSETILAGRLLWAGSGLVTAYDVLAVMAQGLDLTPVTTRLLAWCPEDLRGIVATASITLIGYLMVWLRKRTTRPIEVVAIADKDVTPQVATALMAADIAKDNAVAVVSAAKAA